MTAEPIEIPKFSFSRSQIADFKRCRMKFFYRNVAEIEDTTPGSVPMRFGTLGHAGIAAGMEAFMAAQRQDVKLGREAATELFINTGTMAMAKLIREQTYFYRGKEQKLRLTVEDHADVIKTCGAVFNYYAEHQAYEDYLRYKIIAVEVPYAWDMVVSVNGQPYIVEVSGVFDWVAEDLSFPNKRVLQVADNKFVGNVQGSKSFLPRDTQMLLYELIAWYHAQEQGYDDVQMLYNMIRREVPPGYKLLDGTQARPTTTASGAKSKASTDPKDYFCREELFHSTRQRQAIESNLRRVLKQMVIAHLDPEDAYYHSEIKTGGESCDQCPYSARCTAELVGAGQPRFVSQ